MRIATTIRALILILTMASVSFATVENTVYRDDYSGDGSTVAFTYSFPIYDKSAIEVLVNGVEQTVDTDFTVTGMGAASGTVTFTVAPDSGATVTFLRLQPITQGSDYVPNEGFPSTRVEQDYDKGTMVDQMLQEQVGRSLHVPPESTLTGQQTEVPVETCASKFIMWNASSTGFDCATLTSEGTLADPVQPDHGGTGRDNLTGSTYGGLPAAGTAGRLARITDDPIIPLRLDDGSGWLAIPALNGDGNFQWNSGATGDAIFDHANSVSRTYFFPDLDGTISLTQHYDHSGSATDDGHWVDDTVTLSGGTATVTLTGAAIFTDNASYLCPALYNATQNTQTIQYTRNSGSSITFDSLPETATIEYRCFGN